VFRHDHFATCTSARSRVVSHLGVFFGFGALTAVTLWVITSGINPLVRGEFVYPFSFFSPWKVLANLGGLALLGGCFLMIRDRLREGEYRGVNTYFNWTLLATLFIVVVTGFAAETLHYLRLEPHRHVVYFVHLVFVFALLVTMPYSKFAHLIYRTTALVFAERIGRRAERPTTVEAPVSSEPPEAQP
jgi:quinone-modifying oxidoreductase subunit QmoC